MFKQILCAVVHSNGNRSRPRLTLVLWRVGDLQDSVQQASPSACILSSSPRLQTACVQSPIGKVKQEKQATFSLRQGWGIDTVGLPVCPCLHLVRSYSYIYYRLPAGAIHLDLPANGHPGFSCYAPFLCPPVSSFWRQWLFWTKPARSKSLLRAQGAGRRRLIEPGTVLDAWFGDIGDR